MSTELVPSKRQSRMTDDFFYFFLRLRKDRIRKVVADINARFPEESVEQRARRLIDDQTQLSLLGGLILDLPTMIPGVGHALQILGFVGGTSALVRMHLYLILQIALLYGKDIDDQARVPEMAGGGGRHRPGRRRAFRGRRPGTSPLVVHGYGRPGGLGHVPPHRRERHPLLQPATGGQWRRRPRRVGMKSTFVKVRCRRLPLETQPACLNTPGIQS